MFAYYVQLGWRGLRQGPGLTALMVLAIAVGIGASMTTLTVMHLLSGDPLPGRSAHLFYAQVDSDPSPHRADRAPLDMLDYRSAVDLWSAHRAERQALIVNSTVKVRASDAGRSAEMAPMLSTTASFFAMFDVPFRYGGAWQTEDDTDRARVAVISSALNQRLFGGVNSVGRIVRLRDADVRIVGVLAPWRPSPLFYDVRAGRFSQGDTADFYRAPEDVYTPFETGIEINDGNFLPFTCWASQPSPGHLQSAPCVWVGLWVELANDVQVARYRQFLDDYAKQQQSLGRFVYTGTRLQTLMQWLDFNHVVPSDVRLQSWLAFAFLAVCLCNTIGLLLAKFLRRSGEFGLRRALGASRRAVFAQCLVESAAIGLLGGIGGWLLTLAGLWLIRRQPAAYADLAHLDAGMLVFTFVLALLTSLLAGLLPALRASRVAPAMQLKAL
ncbi:ABC transporter permease [Solimonas marina]|uniref:FtsX-like permease family protein n=1 Tax=Solimonas marina TaxID=2714601 RepID=A0A969WDC1_9GAMM|nr:ABC transporter permease [Solimonas marina]NKF23995.1 FtsX-like permease family protein [Solimonas marina]